MKITNVPLNDINSTHYSLEELRILLQINHLTFKKYTPNILLTFQSTIIHNEKSYFSKSEVDSFCELLHHYDKIGLFEYYFSQSQCRKRRILINGNYYLNTKVISLNFNNISLTGITDNIKKGNFTDYIRMGNEVYISEKEIKGVLDYLANSIPFNDIDDSIIPQSEKNRIQNKNLITKYFPNACKYNIFCNKTWRIPLNEVQNYKLQTQDKFVYDKLLASEKNPQRKYELLVSKHENTIFKDTYIFYNEYANIKISETRVRNIDAFVQNYAKTLDNLLLKLSKNLFNYIDEDIELLITDSIFNSNNKLHISGFLQYMQNKYPKKCRYKNKYNRYIVTEEKSELDYYPFPLWMEYYNYLTDIDKHITKAFNDYMYAKTWLFTILHLTIAWRTADISSIPPIDFVDDIDIYDFEWFKTNTFTISDGQKVINQINMIAMKPIQANKNGIRTHFAVIPELVLSTSIAFITTHFHQSRIMPKTDSLFGITRFQKSIFEGFYELDSLKAFTNRKANSSLITHSFNNAVTSADMPDIAYSLSISMRSHKINDSETSDTTAQYIRSTNTDGDAGKIALHLFRRGEFGWAYNCLIKIATSEKPLTLDEVTNSIESVKNEYSPYAIERYSEFLIDEYKEKKIVINELLTKSKDEIRDIIIAMNKKELSSKTDSIHCLKYSSGKHKCPYKIRTICTACEYKIPTNYTLNIIETELLDLISRLETTSEDNYVYRQKYTFLIVKLLKIVAEAKKEFAIYDKDYINSFIDLPYIQEKIEKLQSSKFLMLKKNEEV